MRVAVVTDSNSGITQKQAEESNLYILPMPFMIDGETFFEDIDLTQEEFYCKMNADADISTSQPSPQAVTDLWDRLLTEYDQVVHIPMSCGLSGACQTAVMLAGEYEGKVQVVDNRRISVTQRQSAMDAVELAARGYEAAQIREILERTAGESTIYVTVDTLKYLKKGGRITPAAAALGTLLKIKPVLGIDGGKLDAFSKARTMKQAKATMTTAIARDLELRLGNRAGQNAWLQIAHTQNEAAAMEFKESINALYPGVPVYVDRLSLSIACHIGPGALALACTKKLKELE